MNPQALPLKDILLPDPVGVWPLASGWYVLIVLLLILLTAAALSGWRWFRQRQRRQLAETLLQQAGSEYARTGNLSNYCRDINTALKRYALSLQASPRLLATTGNDWSTWLNQQVSAPLFNDELADAVAHGPYRPVTVDPDRLQRAARRWIRQARIRSADHD